MSFVVETLNAEQWEELPIEGRHFDCCTEMI